MTQTENREQEPTSETQAVGDFVLRLGDEITDALRDKKIRPQQATDGLLSLITSLIVSRAAAHTQSELDEDFRDQCLHLAGSCLAAVAQQLDAQLKCIMLLRKLAAADKQPAVEEQKADSQSEKENP